MQLSIAARSVIGTEGTRIALSQLGRIRAMIVEWRRRARERSDLRMLTHRDLRDIGVSQSESYAEASKPFWKR
jgi:uncharacterized protein YjiS (DUF1127 family)